LFLSLFFRKTEDLSFCQFPLQVTHFVLLEIEGFLEFVDFVLVVVGARVVVDVALDEVGDIVCKFLAIAKFVVTRFR